jgi:hypothetical protein
VKDYTFTVRYYASDSRMVTVRADNESDALALVQECTPDPCGDDLASNCECDYELEPEGEVFY